jgi:hypothetical protein
MDIQAIRKAYSNASLIDEEKGVFDVSGNKIITEQSKIDAARVELDADYAKVKYKDDRKAEYPSIADQLDDIYHNGIDAWKATIKTTKDKYPKS